MWKCWCLAQESANLHTGRSVAAGPSVASQITTKCIVSAEWSTKEWNRYYSGGNDVSVQLGCINVALLSDVDVHLCPCFCLNRSWAALNSQLARSPTDCRSDAVELLLSPTWNSVGPNWEPVPQNDSQPPQNQHTAQELRHLLPSLNNTQQMNPKITHHTLQPPIWGATCL